MAILGRAGRDASATGRRPDPLEARTQAELMATLRRYRVWAGERSYREMATRLNRQSSHVRIAASTLCAVLSRDKLPRLEMFTRLAFACGAEDDDLTRFQAAWRKIKMAELS
jgi:hypothetical protein